MAPITKICSGCNLEKTAENFHKNKQGYLGLRSQCKPCYKIYTSSYYKKNLEKIKEYKKQYAKTEKAKESNKISCKKKYQKNKSLYLKFSREYAKKRSLTDPAFKLKINLRARFNRAIRGKYKKGSAVESLGCSVEFLKQYLESKFKQGMTWENYGRKGWHIDHIIPLSKFDLTNKEELLKACHYTNLQPLWWYENLEKGAKTNE